MSAPLRTISMCHIHCILRWLPRRSMVLTLDETRRAGAGRSRAGDAHKERAPHGGAGGTALTVLVVAIQEFNSQQIAGAAAEILAAF